MKGSSWKGLQILIHDKVSEAGEASQLARNASIIQWKGYTSDEKLEELDSPLTSIMDKLPPSLIAKTNINGNGIPVCQKDSSDGSFQYQEDLVSTEARVLAPPLLPYHETIPEKDCVPRGGQWSMRNRIMLNRRAVHSWFCINFSDYVFEAAAKRFCYYLGKMCHNRGLVYKREPVFPIVRAKPQYVERDFHNAMIKLEGKKLDLVIVILPNMKTSLYKFHNKNTSLYGDVKRICETRYGIISQCCLDKQVNTMNRHCLENLALKINVKVGGTNSMLVDALSRRLSVVSKTPIIIFGADIIHPSSGDNSSSPSIAAVVASQDWPANTKYASLVSAQPRKQELIQDLFCFLQDPVKGSVTGGMVRELLLSFLKATGYKPHRIIFYRGGISERQLFQILDPEFDAIRKACTSLDPYYQPPVTFVVVHKRRRTKLFANNHNDKRSVDQNGNVLPGTAVDSKICCPTGFDFCLCSQAGIQGTSRPTRYHVVRDENKFTHDEFQLLTNSLCYTSARCTRSLSVVTPIYYAHLAALRARCYIKPETSSSPSSGGPSDLSDPPIVRGLLAVKKELKKKMYYI